MVFCTSCGSPVEGAFCTKCGAKVDAQGAPGAPSPQAPPPAASPVVIPAQAPKKGRFIFWALGGCAVLIVIAVIIVFSTCHFFAHKAGLDLGLMQKNPGLAVAKMVAAANPDIEVVSVDEGRGIIRVRDKKTGKDLTMDLKDAQKGKISFIDDQNKKVEIETHGEGNNAALEIHSSEGTVRMGTNVAGQLPNWLPSYPGAESAGTMAFNTGKTGACALKTKDSVEAVAAFYENALKSAGFEVQKTLTQNTGQGSMAILSASDKKTQRTANVTAAHSEEGTVINLAFETK